MADIINLNQKRKTKARAEKVKKAAENRTKFGRTKEEKAAEKLKKETAEKKLDGHKVEKDEE